MSCPPPGGSRFLLTYAFKHNTKLLFKEIKHYVPERILLILVTPSRCYEVSYIILAKYQLFLENQGNDQYSIL
jgi:hypothetical protein